MLARAVAGQVENGLSRLASRGRAVDDPFCLTASAIRVAVLRRGRRPPSRMAQRTFGSAKKSRCLLPSHVHGRRQGWKTAYRSGHGRERSLAHLKQHLRAPTPPEPRLAATTLHRELDAISWPRSFQRDISSIIEQEGI